jgi:hypothetical protein
MRDSHPPCPARKVNLPYNFRKPSKSCSIGSTPIAAPLSPARAKHVPHLPGNTPALIRDTSTSAADGKGLFVTVGVRGGRDLLHVDLQGNSQLLWENLGGSGETLAVASPDGRHLALNGWTTDGNLWMMENF